jgi:hypothetical protein
MYKEVLTSVDRFPTLRFTAKGAPQANFSDESVFLMADKFRSEVVIIHRSQEVLKMLSLYT